VDKRQLSVFDVHIAAVVLALVPSKERFLKILPYTGPATAQLGEELNYYLKTRTREQELK